MASWKHLTFVAALTVWVVAGCGGAGGPGRAPAGPEPRDPVEAEGRGVLGEDAGPVVVGAILPRSGSAFLEQYGTLVLEGVRLAVDRHNASGGRRIELVVVDDEGDAGIAAARVAELEARGAVAVIGPLRPEAVAAAAAARRDSLLALLSPTASEVPGRPGVYSLNAGDTRGAEALADYAARTGIARVGLFYPRTREYGRQAAAFRRAFEGRGGQIVAEVAYDSGTTTFAEEIRRLVAASPKAVFIPASERDVRQIAPQLVYYGLAETGARVLGGEAWTSEAVLRQVAARYLEGVVAATPLLQGSEEVGWREFVELYENTYRRTLDNPLPALGYDAASLILAALGDGRVEPGTLLRRLDRVEELRGATGVLGIRGGEVVRRPILVRIEGGALVPLGGRPGEP